MSEVKVIIRDERGTETTLGSGQTASPRVNGGSPNPNPTIPTAEAAQNKGQVMATAAAAMAAQQTISYLTSNIGKWTGDSQNQVKFNNMVSVGALIGTAMANPYAAAAMVAVQVGTTMLDHSYEMKWDRRRNRQNLARLGYSSQGEILGRKR